jgi:hypothetical protein
MPWHLMSEKATITLGKIESAAKEVGSLTVKGSGYYEQNVH